MPIEYKAYKENGNHCLSLSFGGGATGYNGKLKASVEHNLLRNFRDSFQSPGRVNGESGTNVHALELVQSRFAQC